MKLSPKIYITAIISFVIIIGFILTAPDSIFHKPSNKIRLNYHWNKLTHQKELIAITNNNSTGYFIYKGRPMGFHYDLLKEYCKEMGFKLNLIVEDDMHKAFNLINTGEADILATDVTFTMERKKNINLTEPHGFNHQVLLQRKNSKSDTTDFIHSVLELEGKKVYVQSGTIFVDQLEYLKKQTGAEFEIVKDKKHTMEELMMMVSEGEIDYTACDERPAMALQTYSSNLDYSLQLSVMQKLCWAVPPKEDSLKISINNWLEDFTKTKRFKSIERMYFSSKKSDYKTDFSYLPGKGGNLTPFDKEIKKYSATIGWDWRLLASLIYQESRFIPETKSWAGALGLMQIMPETGNRMGIDNILSIDGNLQAGTKFIKWLDKQFSKTISDSTERMKFVLAAYNCGMGHIQDAQRLAEKNGKNPSIWTNNTETYLLLKSQPKYYHDKVVKYGFCRGKQTYDFVIEILERYNDYKNLIDE